MKPLSSNQRSRFLFKAITIPLALLGAAGLSHATTSANLLADPGYEFQTTLLSFGAVVSNFAGNQGQWGSENGNFTGPTAGVTPINNTMLAMFASGITSQSTQVTDLSSFAAGIANGNATFTLSALFNVAAIDAGAIANVAVRFYNMPDFSASIGGINGPGLSLDGNVLSWEQVSLTGTIPANALWMSSEVVFGSSSLNGNAGFVDNSVDGNGLTITVVPEPSGLTLGGLGVLAAVCRRKRIGRNSHSL